MVREKPLPLTAYLDNGTPEDTLDNSRWPAGLKAPAARNTGFLHQGSQWWHPPRYEQVVSIIKEGCLRAYRSGMEGVGIHGEVTSRHIPWALNYLAFSHFIHWPEDTLRQFGRKTLGEVFGREDEGERFVEIFANWDAGTLTEEHKKEACQKAKEIYETYIMTGSGGRNLDRWRFWTWISRMTEGSMERHTANIF